MRVRARTRKLTARYASRCRVLLFPEQWGGGLCNFQLLSLAVGKARTLICLRSFSLGRVPVRSGAQIRIINLLFSARTNPESSTFGIHESLGPSIVSVTLRGGLESAYRRIGLVYLQFSAREALVVLSLSLQPLLLSVKLCCSPKLSVNNGHSVLHKPSPLPYTVGLMYNDCLYSLGWSVWVYYHITTKNR